MNAQPAWHEDDAFWLAVEPFLLEERRLDQAWSWIENRWILLTGDRRIEVRRSVRLYSAAEVMALLAAAGFRTVDAFGDLTGRPYEHAAQRPVVVARK